MRTDGAVRLSVGPKQAGQRIGVGVLSFTKLGEVAPGGGEVAMAEACLDRADRCAVALHCLCKAMAQCMGVRVQPTRHHLGDTLRGEGLSLIHI